MDTTITANSKKNKNSQIAAATKTAPPIALANNNSQEIIFNLGLWLSGLQSFFVVGNYAFAEDKKIKTLKQDWRKELELVNTGLLLCSKYTLKLVEIAEIETLSEDFDETIPTSGIDFEEISNLAEDLKNMISINRVMLRSAHLTVDEWVSWSNILKDKLNLIPLVETLVRSAETEGENYLPDTFHKFLQDKNTSFAIETDLHNTLPAVRKILRWLEVIEKMHDNDEPLKPALLLFAHVYENLQEIIHYINNRLQKFPEESGQMFEVLDSMAYAASHEIKKVFRAELAGLSGVRQSQEVYSRIETAYSLLNDLFRQSLVNLARMITPDVEPHQIFPIYHKKLDESLRLRSNLWKMLIMVQKAEQAPNSLPDARLNKFMLKFVEEDMKFLISKDHETIERFVEEIIRTQSPVDLVPLLHRFGAYLETLHGQINMRAVLASYPFDYPQE